MVSDPCDGGGTAKRIAENHSCTRGVIAPDGDAAEADGALDGVGAGAPLPRDAGVGAVAGAGAVEGSAGAGDEAAGVAGAVLGVGAGTMACAGVLPPAAGKTGRDAGVGDATPWPKYRSSRWCFASLHALTWL